MNPGNQKDEEGANGWGKVPSVWVAGCPSNVRFTLMAPEFLIRRTRTCNSVGKGHMEFILKLCLFDTHSFCLVLCLFVGGCLLVEIVVPNSNKQSCSQVPSFGLQIFFIPGIQVSEIASLKTHSFLLCLLPAGLLFTNLFFLEINIQ